jgi:hypothetical protein
MLMHTVARQLCVTLDPNSGVVSSRHPLVQNMDFLEQRLRLP